MTQIKKEYYSLMLLYYRVNSSYLKTRSFSDNKNKGI